MEDPGDLIAPSVVAAFDGWVDSGSAATTALANLADGARVVARFEADRLFDYRARRPTLDILDGRLTEIAKYTSLYERFSGAVRLSRVYVRPDQATAGREVIHRITGGASEPHE